MIEISVKEGLNGQYKFTVSANTRVQVWIEVEEMLKKIKVENPYYIVKNKS